MSVRLARRALQVAGVIADATADAQRMIAARRQDSPAAGRAADPPGPGLATSESAGSQTEQQRRDRRQARDAGSERTTVPERGLRPSSPLPGPSQLAGGDADSDDSHQGTDTPGVIADATAHAQRMIAARRQDSPAAGRAADPPGPGLATSESAGPQTEPSSPLPGPSQLTGGDADSDDSRQGTDTPGVSTHAAGDPAAMPVETPLARSATEQALGEGVATTVEIAPDGRVPTEPGVAQGKGVEAAGHPPADVSQAATVPQSGSPSDVGHPSSRDLADAALVEAPARGEPVLAPAGEISEGGAIEPEASAAAVADETLPAPKLPSSAAGPRLGPDATVRRPEPRLEGPGGMTAVSASGNPPYPGHPPRRGLEDAARVAAPARAEPFLAPAGASSEGGAIEPAVHAATDANGTLAAPQLPPTAAEPPHRDPDVALAPALAAAVGSGAPRLARSPGHVSEGEPGHRLAATEAAAAVPAGAIADGSPQDGSPPGASPQAPPPALAPRTSGAVLARQAAEAPGLAEPSVARRLAVLSGGRLEDDGMGATTVNFQAQGPAAVAATAPQTAPAPVPVESEPEDVLRRDELEQVYEGFLRRLRREFLHDRERLGDLLGPLR
jgi:hypothetical protein